MGDTFYGGAFLRRSPGAGAPTAMTTHIDVPTASGTGLFGGPLTDVAPLDDTWTPTTAIVGIQEADAGGLYLYFTMAEPGRCYLIDDAWLHRKPKS